MHKTIWKSPLFVRKQEFKQQPFCALDAEIDYLCYDWFCVKRSQAACGWEGARR